MLWKHLRGHSLPVSLIEERATKQYAEKKKKRGAERAPLLEKHLTSFKDDLRADLNVATLIIGSWDPAFHSSFSCLHCWRARVIKTKGRRGSPLVSICDQWLLAQNVTFAASCIVRALLENVRSGRLKVCEPGVRKSRVVLVVKSSGRPIRLTAFAWLILPGRYWE